MVVRKLHGRLVTINLAHRQLMLTHVLYFETQKCKTLGYWAPGAHTVAGYSNLNKAERGQDVSPCQTQPYDGKR